MISSALQNVPQLLCPDIEEWENAHRIQGGIAVYCGVELNIFPQVARGQNDMFPHIQKIHRVQGGLSNSHHTLMYILSNICRGSTGMDDESPYNGIIALNS